jgi:hypothetical protein
MEIRKVINEILNHCTFRIQPCTWISIVVALLVAPCTMFLPEHFGWENGLIENIQLIVLAIGFIFSVKAKDNKQFFYFAAMVIVILLLREVNCGRTIFFPIPGEPNAFYKWSQIKYGYLAHPIYGAYIAYTALYFIMTKSYNVLVKFLTKFRLPVWNILLMLVGMFVGLYAEKRLGNCLLEEMGELLFYVALVGIIYLFAFQKAEKSQN